MMDVCAELLDNMSEVFTPILSLDYDRIISAWEGSPFSASDATCADELGDFFLDMEAMEESNASLQLDFKETFPVLIPQYNSAPPTPQQQHLAPASHHAYTASRFMPRMEQQQQQQQQMMMMARPPAHVSASSEALADSWWGAPQQQAACIKVESAQAGFYDSMGPFAPSSGCLSNSNSDNCIVPDSGLCSASSAGYASADNNAFGLVPHGSPFLCMAPLAAVPSSPAMPLPATEGVRMRQECLRRYREKKARRMYTKMIRYQLRKINADKRPRIKGRFVKKGVAEDLAVDSECMAGSEQVDECMSDDSS